MNNFYAYLKKQRLEIGVKVQGKTIVYLDLNYWIRLRDAKQNKPKADKAFYEQIFQLHSDKKCIFPISEVTFWEVLKQSDKDSRRATIELIDELSDGIAIIDMRERVKLETRTWLLKAIGKPVYELDELVWTNLAFVIGYEHILMLPTVELQCQAVEKLSTIPLKDLIEPVNETFVYKDNVEMFNKMFKENAHQYKSYEELFVIEVIGIVDACSELIKDAFDAMYYSDNGIYPTAEQRSMNKTPQLIANAFRLGKIKTELPFFHIGATLHCWTRWKQKPFKDGNDTIDFYHATFALPYAHYFFTDRRLANGIIESKLDTLYNCQVEHMPEKAMKILQAL